MKAFTFSMYCLLASLAASQAQASNSPEQLIQNCKELLGIYTARDQQHLLAGLVTSTSDALRAGICRGMLDEYRRKNYCVRDDWYVQARKIVEFRPTQETPLSVPALLKASCDI